MTKIKVKDFDSKHLSYCKQVGKFFDAVLYKNQDLGMLEGPKIEFRLLKRNGKTFFKHFSKEFESVLDILDDYMTHRDSPKQKDNTVLGLDKHVYARIPTTTLNKKDYKNNPLVGFNDLQKYPHFKLNSAYIGYHSHINHSLSQLSSLEYQ